MQVSIVMEQFIRLLHECGMPLADMDFINSDGPVMNKLLLEVSLVSMADLHLVFVICAHSYIHVTLSQHFREFVGRNGVDFPPLGLLLVKFLNVSVLPRSSHM
jgi:hypothetical protein